jgi:hypothetical protein
MNSFQGGSNTFGSSLRSSRCIQRKNSSPTRCAHWFIRRRRFTYTFPSTSPIAHPLVDPRTSPICLITKDPQREYKDLVAQQGIKFISRVVGIEKLKGKFKPFEARRMLLRENGLFLADERVVPLLPKLLGKRFFEAKKYVPYRPLSTLPY